MLKQAQESSPEGHRRDWSVAAPQGEETELGRDRITLHYVTFCATVTRSLTLGYVLRNASSGAFVVQTSQSTLTQT